MKQKVLVDGNIPANTVCPFKFECKLAPTCHHMGKDHSVSYSCACARLHEMFGDK
jgi:hypothetical protein